MTQRASIIEEQLALNRLREAGTGAAVESTPEALRWGAVKPIRTRGVIVGWGRSKVLVRVRKDGRKTASTYHVTFWAPVAEASR